MPVQEETLYDLLGVPRDAKNTDIGRAYNRLRAEMQRETAAPDEKRAARLREAFDVLSDPQRREAYDRSIARGRTTQSAKRIALVAGSLIALIALALVFLLRPAAAPQKSVRTTEEILADASRSVARVQAIDISGNSLVAGVAFTIRQGVMLATCRGLSPDTQLVVNLAPRSVPARVAMVDEELGLCKLAVAGAGSWPLALSSVEPKAGDTVYGAGINAAGQVRLTEGVVKRVFSGPKARFIESTVPVSPGSDGAPLFDADGRVVGVATLSQDGGKGRHVIVASAWAEQGLEAPREPSRATVPTPASPPSAPAGTGQISDERREALGKSFRPPPQVPDDL